MACWGSPKENTNSLSSLDPPAVGSKIDSKDS